MTNVNDRYQLWKYTPFEQWVVDEGLKVITGQIVDDILATELESWDRSGCDAALLDLTADPLEGALINNQGTLRYLCDIPPGGTFKREKHMYEEIFYVAQGRGATSVWYEPGPKQTFEWHEGSVFSIPLNAWHEIYNGSGSEKVRLYVATNMPTTFNLFMSPEYVFNSDAQFLDRFDPDDELYFSGQTVKLEDRYMQTNFISSVNGVALDRWVQRGPGANMMIIMSGGNFICHVSEFPEHTYKKAHTGEFNRPRAALPSDVAYLMLSGEGYDLQWPAGTVPGAGVPFDRLDYRTNSLLTPGTGYHQHFNTGAEPIRYLVLRYGNPRYRGVLGARSKDHGGKQIEFEDQDPAVDALFEAELAKGGSTSAMAAAMQDD